SDDELDRRSEDEMDVRVHEPGNDVLAGNVDLAGAGGNRDAPARADGGDLPPVDHDDAVFDRRGAGAVNERGTNNRRDRFGRRHAAAGEKRNEQQRPSNSHRKLLSGNSIAEYSTLPAPLGRSRAVGAN